MTPERVLAMARRGDTAEARRLRRKIASVGRGVQLGLATVPGVVLANVYEHGSGDPRLPIGTVVVEIWGGEWAAVIESVDRYRPMAVLVIPVVHPDTRWARARAWWRWIVDRYLRRRWSK